MTGTGGTLPGTTVTLKLHWLALPAPSAAEQTTAWLPTPKIEPEGGKQTGKTALEQSSEAAGLKVTTELNWLWALVTSPTGWAIQDRRRPVEPTSPVALANLASASASVITGSVRSRMLIPSD